VPTLRPPDDAARQPDGTPTALLTGHEAFMGLDLLVAPGVLVPRAETELLARTAVDALQALAGPSGDAAAPRVVDVCCGAGNLACAIATRVPGARVWAADLTEACVDTARRNVARLRLDGRVSVHRGDLLGALDGLGLAGTVDMVVANPPYISTARLTEGDRRHLLAHEPIEAFDGGPYGLSIHQRLTREAPAILGAGGLLLFEFGLGQQRQVELLFRRARAFAEVRFVGDAAGEPRVAVARLAGAAATGPAAR
jgi:release factor glutamine methyltransferase